MKLKTILPVVAVAGVLMCEPAVLLHAGTSDFASPEAMGWFRKKKKSETKDSVQSKSDYEKLTGSDAIARKGMFNVYQKKSDYYFEVPARLLGRDMLVVNKLQRVPSELNEAGVNRGTNYENQMVRFELDKAANKSRSTIFMMVRRRVSIMSLRISTWELRPSRISPAFYLSKLLRTMW